MGKLIPPSTKRVELHTKDHVNKNIQKKTNSRLQKYKEADFELLSKRIYQLNKEWDTERVLETNASLIILVTTILGFYYHYYWFIAPGVISFFLLQHAIVGWCPPLPIIRRLGVRTPEEINDEKVVMKWLRGDFSEQSKDIHHMYEVMLRD